MSNFYLGQEFNDVYPVEAHDWCLTQDDYYVKLVETQENGTMLFKIVSTETDPFYIGQVFIYAYPPQAAVWCNERQDCYIEDIEPLSDGTRCFKIVEIVTPPLPELDAYKEQRKSELTTLHEAAEKEAHVLCSLGFEINANDRAYRDVQGLLLTTNDGEMVQFRDYSNIVRTLTKNDLITMQKEIVLNMQSLYSQKWMYRSYIESCESSAQLNNLNFTFINESFYKA